MTPLSNESLNEKADAAAIDLVRAAIAAGFGKRPRAGFSPPPIFFASLRRTVGDDQVGRFQKHRRPGFDSVAVRCIYIGCISRIPKSILGLKNMGFCSVVTRRLQFRRSGDDAEAKCRLATNVSVVTIAWCAILIM
jgi:hypothetical protein